MKTFLDDCKWFCCSVDMENRSVNFTILRQDFYRLEILEPLNDGDPYDVDGATRRYPMYAIIYQLWIRSPILF
jgi:hypothetical protein